MTSEDKTLVVQEASEAGGRGSGVDVPFDGQLLAEPVRNGIYKKKEFHVFRGIVQGREYGRIELFATSTAFGTMDYEAG